MNRPDDFKRAHFRHLPAEQIDHAATVRAAADERVAEFGAEDWHEWSIEFLRWFYLGRPMGDADGGAL